MNTERTDLFSPLRSSNTMQSTDLAIAHQTAIYASGISARCILFFRNSVRFSVSEGSYRVKPVLRGDYGTIRNIQPRL